MACGLPYSGRKEVQEMKRLIGLIAIIVLLSVLVPVLGVGAVSGTATITITATGAVLDISVAPTSWSVGTVIDGSVVETALTTYQLNNLGATASDVTIAGRQMEDAEDITVVTWTMSNDGTGGATEFGMQAGLEGGSFNLPIKNVGQSGLSKVGSNLAGSAHVHFGLQFTAPTSGVTATAMYMVGAAGNHDDADAGLLLTASVYVAP
jgi:hypothetical protein